MCIGRHRTPSQILFSSLVLQYFGFAALSQALGKSTDSPLIQQSIVGPRMRCSKAAPRRNLLGSACHVLLRTHSEVSAHGIVGLLRKLKPCRWQEGAPFPAGCSCLASESGEESEAHPGLERAPLQDGVALALEAQPSTAHKWSAAHIGQPSLSFATISERPFAASTLACFCASW